MAPISKLQNLGIVKALDVGDSGVGKTGAKASLICMGYRVIMGDMDNGSKILYSLLTDPRYPYLDWIQRKGIDLDKALDVIQFENEFTVGSVQSQIQLPGGKTGLSEIMVLKPKTARAWTELALKLNNWDELGSIYSWDNKTIFNLDSFTTTSDSTFSHFQSLNNRLGRVGIDNAYKRDVNLAQTQLRTLLQALFSKSVKCNVIVTGHIRYLDDDAHYIQTPEQILGDERIQRRPNPKGYLRSVGSALSPIAGIYFNDMYHTKIEGTRRTIYTEPVDNIAAKKSVWLKRSYDISTGWAEIFARQRGEPEPRELMEALSSATSVPESIPENPASTTASKPQSFKPRPLGSLT